MSDYPIIKFPELPRPERPEFYQVEPRVEAVKRPWRISIALTVLLILFSIDLPWLLFAIPVAIPLVWLNYRRQVKRNQEHYQKELDRYKHERQEYQKRLKRYEKLLEPENLLEYQRRNFKPQWDVLNRAKKGKSEQRLKECLVKHLGEKILQREGEPAIRTGYEPPFDLYTVDMAYWDGDILVDIEVDEPYSNGKPIHYQGADDRRNALFSQRGWVVLRFSERQAKCQPNACCRVLVETVNQMKQRLGIEPLKLTILDRITPEPHWTEQEALAMLSQDIRDSY